MHRAAWMAAAAAVGVSLAISSLASAGSGVHGALEAPSIDTVVSDGSRFVYYDAPEPGTVVVRDDQRGTRRRFAVPNGCKPTAAYPGMGLLQCPDRPPASHPTLLDPRTGNTVSFPVTYLDADVYLAIGRYWMVGARCASDAGHCAPMYRNWRTGERRAPRYGGDLDTPDLAPLGRHSADRVTFGRGGALVLVHRGVRRTISDCRPSCEPGSPTTGGGLVTWVEGGRGDSPPRLVRYSVRSRRRWVRTIRPPSIRKPMVVRVMHTRTRVYVAVTSGPRDDRLYRFAY